MTRIDCRDLSTAALPESEEIAAAYDCFTKQGYAILDHVVAEDKIEKLNVEFDARYAQYLQDREAEDSLEVGKRRFMVPVRLDGGFGDPAVFANPFVTALVRKILGADAILEAFGAINSLSGSEAQHVHRDGPPLFNADISLLLPAHALTFALPLVEMNIFRGTTAIWPGSHRWKASDESIPPECPKIPVGSCLLWDFRLFHSGTPNRSERHRPMIYATYARRWYQDPVNFVKDTQPRLLFDSDFIDGVPAESRSLLAGVR